MAIKGSATFPDFAWILLALWQHLFALIAVNCIRLL